MVGRAQVEVAVTTGDYELAVAGTRQRVLQDDVLGRRPVHFVQQRVGVVGGCPGVRKSHCHVFLERLDPGQAPLKTLLLMLRQT